MAHLRDPLGSLLHWTRIDRNAVNAAVALSRDETGILQHSEMLRNRRQGHVERLRQLANRRLTERKARQDGPAGRIAECGECSIEIVNQLV
jgi:hypothetical protein